MSISAATFTRANPTLKAPERVNNLKAYTWSKADIFLSCITLCGYALARLIYQSYNGDKKVGQYFRGNIAVFDAYKKGSVLLVGQHKSVTVNLNGSLLTVQETGTKDRPTLTYMYNGTTSCTGDKGIYTTLDAWILTEFAKMKSDDELFGLYKQYGGVSAQDRTQYYPEQFTTDKANFENVDFSLLAPGGINLSGISLKKANFKNAKLTNVDFNNSKLTLCSFENAQLTGTIFSGSKIQSTSFLKTESSINNANFCNTEIDNDSTVPSLFPNSTVFSNPISFSGSNKYQANTPKHTESTYNSSYHENTQRPNFHYHSTTSDDEEPPITEIKVNEYCKALGILPKTKGVLTPEEVEKAYRSKALKLHPDKNPQNSEEINEAYEIRVNVPFKNINEAKEQLIKWISQ